MNVSVKLIWNLIFMFWINIGMCIGLCYIIHKYFTNSYGVKGSTNPRKDLDLKDIKKPNQKEIYPLKEHLESMEERLEGADKRIEKEVNNIPSDVDFKSDFFKRINRMKNELEYGEDVMTEYPGVPPDVDNTFEYDEMDEYMPSFREGSDDDGVPGVEIITDEYEKQIERRIK